MHDLIAFFQCLLFEMKNRRKGVDVPGNTRGTDNGEQSMMDLRAVSNLVETRLRSLPLHTQVSLIGEAARRPARAKLIPSSAVTPDWLLLEELQLLQSDRLRSEKATRPS